MSITVLYFLTYIIDNIRRGIGNSAIYGIHPRYASPYISPHIILLARVHVAMSSGVVRAATWSILEDSDFCMKSRNAETSKKLAASLLDAVVENDLQMDVFDRFSSSLIEKIHTASLIDHGQKRSQQKAWKAFHALRIGELNSLWSDLFEAMGMQTGGACTG